MPDQHQPLIAGRVYHLFNRGIGFERIFLEHENYSYFLRKMRQYIVPVAEIYAYSLMPNHFHLLVRIKSQQELEAVFLQRKGRHFGCADSMPAFVMQQFSNWLNGYAKAFNKRYKRMGGLFMDYIKRTAVDKDADIPGFIFYIHKNAVHHGLKNHIGEWMFDSYNILIRQEDLFLKCYDVIRYFGSLEAFARFHDQPVRFVKSWRSV